MGRPKVDLARKIGEILGHSEALPEEAATPLRHYKRSGADILNLLDYVELSINRRPHYPAVWRRHEGRLNGMVLVTLIETFERYLKEVAAACVDCLHPHVLDEDRFDFKISAGALVAHFEAKSLGKSLCESATWLDCETINTRFKKLLADPFEKGSFNLLPPRNSAKTDPDERWRFETLDLVWQLRHTVVHNVGVITRSDAVKFRLLVKAPVESPRILTPTRDDLRYLQQFLDETTIWCNGRIGRRLADLLTTIHKGDPGLFPADEMATRISQIFDETLTVAGVQGTSPFP